MEAIYAQSQPPDSGAILRELEKQEPKLTREAVVVSYEPSETKKAKKGETIFIKGFKFTGAKVLSETELNKLLKGFIGRDVDVTELDTATTKIVECYVKKGYVAKVIVPPQEIKDGIVEISIIIGQLEGYTTSKEKTRFNKNRAIRIINNAQGKNKIITISNLEKGLLLINDIPGVKAISTVHPGKKEAGVLVDLDIKDNPLVNANIGYDDYGIHSTGTQRMTAALSFNDPFSIGDQIYGSFIYTGLMGYESLTYSLPIGYSGMRGGLSSSHLHYRLGKEFSYLQGKGGAFTIGPYLSWPLIRSCLKNVYVLANFFHKNFKNELSGNIINDKKADVGNIYLNVDAYDKFCGGGYTSSGLGFSLGNLNLEGNQGSYALDQTGPGTSGIYSKFSFFTSRIQYITEKTSLNLKLNGQLALHNLDSSEQFSLGGPDGVRAYSTGDANGDHGFVATAELSRVLWNEVKVSGFYDFGYIIQHYKTYAGSNGAIGKNSYALDSVGIGVMWTPSKVKWFVVKASGAVSAAFSNSGIINLHDFGVGIGRNSCIFVQAAAII
ncbi:putative ShlB/FhaC/HecB family hemolysin secretion/activation protein [Gammaproteobacteria bacterium]